MSAKSIRQATNNSKIYDYFYKRFTDHIKCEVATSTKSKRIDEIMSDLNWDDQEVIRARIKYSNLNYDTMSKITNIPKKKLIKKMDIATKHMYSPKNIRIAVPKYYKITKKNQTKLTESDFGSSIYILNRLHESGIMTREQLFRHLELGWYYLWTIPGCGDASRQIILMAIDKWKSKK